ncbi:MAG: UDP-glucose 6-dehydrogenase [Elusimicrobia bacterium RIFCSPLOWO2_01_FULL_60_11]|nr:MAG: UDP-glucose 6-dehydrogenase [Elusimicrobia bacterium RIFCSPLOWO2_01_FULL_60_11]
MNICMIGTGYVGLVTGACFAELGYKVTCVDNDPRKIGMLKIGEMPIYEPGLEKLVRKNVAAKRLFFSMSIADAIQNADFAFIAVGTPPRSDGSADLSYVENVAREIATHMKKYLVIVEKSTVPVETCEWVKKTVTKFNRKKVPFDVVSNPEFLREGTAVHDFSKPDRVIVGVESERAKKAMARLYAPLRCPIVFTDTKSAEIIKHASNSFLATKISYINSVARICEKVGANVEQVAQGMGFDPRIGRSFLNAGCGFGGFCFPKDLEAFLWISKKLGADFEMLESVKKVNEEQMIHFVRKIEESLWIVSGKTVGILGLAFKPHTDDMRFAPSIDIIRMLQERGAKIQAYDPISMPNAKKVLQNVALKDSIYEAARGADALVIVTEWPQFKKMDLKKIKKLLTHPTIVDGRNLFDPEAMKKLGFHYASVGRKPV